MNNKIELTETIFFVKMKIEGESFVREARRSFLPERNTTTWFHGRISPAKSVESKLLSNYLESIYQNDIASKDLTSL